MSFLTSLNVAEAREELQTLTCAQIEYKTAAKWAARAYAAMELYRSTGDLKWLALASEFGSEALEHAAAAGDGHADAMRAELYATGARL